jgi:hypothetical protein
LKETLKSKRVTTSRCFFAAAFLFAFSCAQAQTTLIIPQIVDGGAWLTTIALTNTSASQTVASLSFFQETGGGDRRVRCRGALQRYSLNVGQGNQSAAK